MEAKIKLVTMYLNKEKNIKNIIDIEQVMVCF